MVNKSTSKPNNRCWKILIYAIISLSIFIILAIWHLVRSLGAENSLKKEAAVNRLVAESLAKSREDNTLAIRMLEFVIRQSKGEAPSIAYQALSDIFYSSVQRPFYLKEISLDADDIINDVVFSPDSRLILLAHESGKFDCYDIDGKRLIPSEGENSRLMSIDFAPKSEMILTATWNGVTSLWRKTGKLHPPFELGKSFKHGGQLYNAVFSPDGKTILTSSRENCAQLWDLNWTHKHDLKHNGPVISGCFSKDGKYILTGSWDKTAKLWNLSAKDKQPIVFPHQNNVTSANFVPKSDTILTCSWDNFASLWDFRGKRLCIFRHQGKVTSATASPDGNTIGTAARDGTVRLWRLKKEAWTPVLVSQIKHGAEIKELKFSPNSKHVIVGTLDGTIRLYNIDGSVVAHFNRHSNSISSVEFSPDGNYLFTASNWEVALWWDLNNLNIKKCRCTQEILEAHISPNGDRVLALLKQEGSAKLWDGKCTLLATLKQKRSIFSCSFSSAGDRIMTASRDGTIYLWNMQGEQPKRLQISNEDKQVYLLLACFIKDGTKILTASESGNIRLSDLDGNISSEFNSDDPISYAAVSPSGAHIITISNDRNRVIFWTMEGKKLTWFNQKDIHFAGIANDGSRVFTSTQEEIILRDIAGQILQKTNLIDNNIKVKAIGFGTDSSWMLIKTGGGSESNLKRWELGNPDLVDFIPDKFILSFQVSCDNNFVITTSLDGYLKIWSPQGAPLFRVKNSKPLKTILLSRGGNRLAAISRDSDITFILRPSGIMERLESAKFSKLPAIVKGYMMGILEKK